jgi:hypothetical protein
MSKCKPTQDQDKIFTLEILSANAEGVVEVKEIAKSTSEATNTESEAKASNA